MSSFHSYISSPLQQCRSFFPHAAQVGRVILFSQAGTPQSFFAVLSHKYELADSAEALLSDLSLPNGTTMSPATPALFVLGDCVFDTVGDAGGEVDEVELVGDRGRNVDFCWLAEAMLGCFAKNVR